MRGPSLEPGGCSAWPSSPRATASARRPPCRGAEEASAEGLVARLSGRPAGSPSDVAACDAGRPDEVLEPLASASAKALVDEVVDAEGPWSCWTSVWIWTTRAEMVLRLTPSQSARARTGLSARLKWRGGRS